MGVAIALLPPENLLEPAGYNKKTDYDSSRPFGRTGLFFYPLQPGSLWFGRKWPENNDSYKRPSDEEIATHLLAAYEQLDGQEGVLMIDTSAAYGDGEKRIGTFFDNQKKILGYDLRERTYIATKWGLRTDFKTTLYTVKNLRKSLGKSIKRLGRVDLLYVHFSSYLEDKDLNVLRGNAEVVGEMERLKSAGKIKHIGITISNETMLETAIQERLITPFDVVQMYASVFIKRPDLIEELQRQGKAIVVNSPYRKREDKSIFLETVFENVLRGKGDAVILSSMRNHFRENVDFVSKALARIHGKGKADFLEVLFLKTA